MEVTEGGSNEIENLIHLHKKCHLHIHSEKKKKVSKKA
ncbi:HNH endonuclease [Okeania sp. SIO3B5]